MQAEACLPPSRNSKEASKAAAERGRGVVVGGEVREQGWVGEGLAEPGFVGPMITTPLLCGDGKPLAVWSGGGRTCLLF